MSGMKQAFSQHRNTAEATQQQQQQGGGGGAPSTTSTSSNSSSAGGATGFQPPYPRSQQHHGGGYSNNNNNNNNQQQLPPPPPAPGYGQAPHHHHHHHHHHHQRHHHHHHHHHHQARGFSGNNNYNNNNNAGGVGHFQHHHHHHQGGQNNNNNNNNNMMKRNANSNNNLDEQEKPTGTTGQQVDLAANVEVYAHGQDKIYTIPRDDILFIPPPLEGDSTASSPPQQQGGGNNNNNQQQQQKLQLCPNFDPENPEESCTLGNRCRFVHAKLANANIHDIHCNYAYASPEECRYETYSSDHGLLHIAPPNSNTAQDEVPSTLVLKTRALQSSRRVISHCAHYYFNRVCNRGSECYFIHAISLVPIEGGSIEDNKYRRVWGRTQNRNRGMNQHGSANSLSNQQLHNHNNNNGGTNTPTPTPSIGGFPRNESHGSLNEAGWGGGHGGHNVYANATPPRGHTPVGDSQFPSALDNGAMPNTSASALALGAAGAGGGGSNAPPSYNQVNNAGGASNATSPNKYGQQQSGVTHVGGRTTPPPVLPQASSSSSVNAGFSSNTTRQQDGSRSPNRQMRKSPSQSNMVNAFAPSMGSSNSQSFVPDSPMRGGGAGATTGGDQQGGTLRRQHDPYSTDRNVRIVKSPVAQNAPEGFGPTNSSS